MAMSDMENPSVKNEDNNQDTNTEIDGKAVISAEPRNTIHDPEALIASILDEPTSSVVVLSYSDSAKKVSKFTAPYAAFAISLAAINTAHVLVLIEAKEDDALASMSLIGILIYFTMSLAKGTIDASSLLVSRLREERQDNPAEVGDIVRIGYTVAMGISAGVVLFFSNTPLLTNAFSVHPDIVDNVDTYFSYFAMAIPAIMWLTASQKIALGFGNSTAAAVIGLCFSTFGIPVSFPLVLIAEKGLTGLAIGAIFSAWTVAIGSTAYFKLTPRYAQYELFKLHINNFSDNMAIFLKMGLPLGLQNATEHISTLFINNFMGRWKEASMASQVTTRTNSFISAIAGSLSIASGILVARYLGKANHAKEAGQFEDAHNAITQASQIGNASIAIGCSAALLMSLAYLTIPNSLTNIFVDFSKYDTDSNGEHIINPEQTRNLAHNMLFIDAFAIVANALREITLGNLSGYKEIIVPTFISFASTTLIALPISTALVFMDGEDDADRSVYFYTGRALAYAAAGGLIGYRWWRRCAEEHDKIDAMEIATTSETPDEQRRDIVGETSQAQLLNQLGALQQQRQDGEMTDEITVESTDSVDDVPPLVVDETSKPAEEEPVTTSWGFGFSSPCTIL